MTYYNEEPLKTGPWDHWAEGYTRLPNRILDSPAALTLSPRALIVLIQFLRLWHAAAGDGKTPVSYVSFTWSRSRFPMARGTFYSAVDELGAHGFIVCVDPKIGRYRWQEGWITYVPPAQQVHRLESFKRSQAAQRTRTIVRRQKLDSVHEVDTVGKAQDSVQAVDTVNSDGDSGQAARGDSGQPATEHSVQRAVTLHDSRHKNASLGRAREDIVRRRGSPSTPVEDSALPVNDQESVISGFVDRIRAITHDPAWWNWFREALGTLWDKGGNVIGFEEDIKKAEDGAALHLRGSKGRGSLKSPLGFLVSRLQDRCRAVSCGWPDFPPEAPTATSGPPPTQHDPVTQRCWELRQEHPELSNGEIAEIVTAKEVRRAE